MPNNTNERKGKQAGELSAEERFRNFFSTSVIDSSDLLLCYPYAEALPFFD